MKKFGEQSRAMSLEKKNLTSSPSFDDDDDFEFAVSAPSESPICFSADEVFSGGKILPVYPVFNRSLLLQRDPINVIEDPVNIRSGSTSSEESEFSPPAGDFCAWNPRSTPQSPDRCKKKSSSTGSSSGSKLKDLMTGRSHSDGKEKILYVAPEKERNRKPNRNPSPNLNKEGEGDKKKKTTKPKEMDLITAHRLFYGKESAAKGVKGGRAYLPHRPGPVGLFANGNGLSRTTFPF